MKKILCFCFAGFSMSSQAQQPLLAWAKQLTGSDVAYISKVAVDHKHVYSLGQFNDTCEISYGVNQINVATAGDLDMVISRFDLNGNPVWSYNFGSIKSDFATDISFDSLGNSYICGHFRNTVDFDPGPGVFQLKADTNHVQSFALKLDSSGNFVWAKKFGIGPYVIGGGANHIKTNSTGDSYITCVSDGKGDFDPGPGTFTLNGSQSSCFLLKLNSSGDFQWVKKIEAYKTVPAGVALGTTGEVWLLGAFTGTADLDPGPATYTVGVPFGMITPTEYSTYVVNLDTAGNFKKGITLGGEATGLTLKDANLYVNGMFSNGETDFDPGPGTYTLNSPKLFNTSIHTYYLKIDTSMAFQWAKAIHGAGFNLREGLTVDSQDNIYFCVGAIDSIDYDPGPGVFYLAPTQKSSPLVLHLNSSGNFLWAENIHGALGHVYSTCIDQSDNLYFAGAFSGTGDFAPGNPTYTMMSVADSIFYEPDGFIAKWGTPATLSVRESKRSNVLVYPNPCRDELIIKNCQWETEAKFVDVNGREIVTAHHFNEAELLVNTSLLSPGVYVLQLKQGQSCQYIKVVRE